MAHRTLQKILIGAGLCLILVGCAPVQAVEPTPVPRQWFTRLELETALIEAGLSPAEAGAVGKTQPGAGNLADTRRVGKC